MSKFFELAKQHLSKLAVATDARGKRNPDVDVNGYFRPPPPRHSAFEQQQRARGWLRSSGAWERLFGE